MEKLIPYGRQEITEQDIQIVIETLKSDFLTQGPAIQNFESSLSQYLGSTHAVAVSNGTAGLHIAYLAAGVQKGDAVFVPATTFAATANAAIYCGATPVFVDIDPNTLCMSPESLELAIDLALKAHLQPKIIAPVYFAGRPVDSMLKFIELAKHFGMLIIEDACHAIGAEYRLSDNNSFIKVGGSSFADMTVFSFHPVKHITTGEGGAVSTQNKELYKKLCLFRSHGITKDASHFVNRDLALDSSTGEHNSWYHEMQTLGYNYRLTDIQAALGKNQLSRIQQNISRRREIASQYDDAFKNIKHVITPPSDSMLAKHSYHLYPLRINFQDMGTTRQQFMQSLKKEGIGSQVHYLPVHWHPYYQDNKDLWKAVETPEAEKFYSQELSIPMYSSLSNEEINKVITIIKSQML